MAVSLAAWAGRLCTSRDGRLGRSRRSDSLLCSRTARSIGSCLARFGSRFPRRPPRTSPRGRNRHRCGNWPAYRCSRRLRSRRRKARRFRSHRPHGTRPGGHTCSDSAPRRTRSAPERRSRHSRRIGRRRTRSRSGAGEDLPRDEPPLECCRSRSSGRPDFSRNAPVARTSSRRPTCSRSVPRRCSPGSCAPRTPSW